MKKIVGLFLLMLIGSTSVFAQGDGRRQGIRTADREQFESIISDMSLSVTQAEELRRIEDNYQSKLDAESQIWTEDQVMEAEMKKRKAVIDQLKKEKNEELKSVLTDDQYNQYKEREKMYRDKTPGECTK